MIETKTKKIGDATYRCTQFTARKGVRIQQRLLKLLAPVIGEGISAVKGGGGFLEADIDFEAMGGAIRELLLGVASDLDVDFMLELLSSTTRENKAITEGEFDMEFAGKYRELAQVLYFVVETNYGSFFDGVDWRGLADLVPTARVPAPTPSTESSTPH